MLWVNAFGSEAPSARKPVSGNALLSASAEESDSHPASIIPFTLRSLSVPLPLNVKWNVAKSPTKVAAFRRFKLRAVFYQVKCGCAYLKTLIFSGKDRLTNVVSLAWGGKRQEAV